MNNDNNLIRNNKFLLFLRNNYFLVVALAICAFMAFFNLGDIEFWGEDEGQTLLYASRFIMGLRDYSLSNLTAFYNNSTLSFVILIQIPFILIFGVWELASRMPSALVTILTLLVFYKIGQLFLDKRSTNFLVLLYAVSGAVGLFKSSIGVGFYIFFILLGFYKLEKFLFAKDIRLRGKFADFHLSLILITMALVSVPDAYFYIPFFIILILVNIKKIGLKKLLLSLIMPVILFSSFVYLEFFLPLKLTGLPNATYEHYIHRRTGLEFVFNIKNLFFGYITSYSIFLVSLFIIAVVVLLILKIKKIIRIPIILIHVLLLFCAHFIFWMFLMKMESGHLLNSYPVVLLFIAYFYKVSNDLINNKKNLRIKVKRIFVVLVNVFFAVFICLSFYHTYILFNDLSLNKEKYPAFYTPGSLPSGYNSGHKIGIKSAAYLLREDQNVGERLVTNIGTAFNFIYMGGELVPYSANNAIELMKAGENIYDNYRIRFVAVSPNLQNKEYLQYIDSRSFNKVIIMHDGEEIYYVYDILKNENLVTVIDRDQYDNNYIREYARIDKALPYYFNF